MVISVDDNELDNEFVDVLIPIVEQFVDVPTVLTDADAIIILILQHSKQYNYNYTNNPQL